MLESLSLWLKYLTILHGMLDYLHRVVEAKKWCDEAVFFLSFIVVMFLTVLYAMGSILTPRFK